MIPVTMLMVLGWSMGLTFGSMNTVQSHAYLLCNIHGVFSLIFMMLTCRSTHKYEKAGTAIVLIGVVIMLLDPKAVRKGEQINLGISALCLLTNIPGMVLWMGMDYLTTNLDLVTVLVTEFFCCAIYVTILSLIFEGTSMDISNNGIFGFLQKDQLFLNFFWNSAISAFWGFSGYVIAFLYFSPLIIMNVVILEPFTG